MPKGCAQKLFWGSAPDTCPKMCPETFMTQIFIKTFLGTFLGTLLGTPFGTPSQFVGTLFGTRLGTHFKAHFWDTLRGTLWASPPLFHQRKGRDGEACSEEEPLILLPNCFKAAQSCCFSSSQRPNAQKFKGKLSSSIYFSFFYFSFLVLTFT